MPNEMELWNKVCKTNPSYAKEVKYGARKFIAIDAHSQIMKATELWGPFGSTWGVTDEKFTMLNEKLLLYTAKLYYGGDAAVGANSFLPLHSSIELGQECIKKVATDALTKGLSKLGFNADVFLGKFDDNHYVQQMKSEFKEPKTESQEVKDQTAKDHAALDVLNSKGLTKKQQDDLWTLCGSNGLDKEMFLEYMKKWFGKKITDIAEIPTGFYNHCVWMVETIVGANSFEQVEKIYKKLGYPKFSRVPRAAFKTIDGMLKSEDIDDGLGPLPFGEK